VDRRMFLGTLAGGLLALPLPAGAQEAGKVPRIVGFESVILVRRRGRWMGSAKASASWATSGARVLLSSTATPTTKRSGCRLWPRSWSASGRTCWSRSLRPPVRALQGATTTIPIVFLSGDPLRLGLVETPVLFPPGRARRCNRHRGPP
jgi:hypothetical protein